MYSNSSLLHVSLFTYFTSNTLSRLEFLDTRIFMKLFRTSSSLVVRECQVNFGFLPIESQFVVPTANFLQKFVASENSLCLLFDKNATHQLNQFCSLDMEIMWYLLISSQLSLMIFFAILATNQGWLLINELVCVCFFTFCFVSWLTNEVECERIAENYTSTLDCQG